MLRGIFISLGVLTDHYGEKGIQPQETFDFEF
jgi:hypothetical protein